MKLLSKMAGELARYVGYIQSGMDLQTIVQFAGTCQMDEECFDDARSAVGLN